jgi:hypothetical protein
MFLAISFRFIILLPSVSQQSLKAAVEVMLASSSVRFSQNEHGAKMKQVQPSLFTSRISVV